MKKILSYKYSRFIFILLLIGVTQHLLLGPLFEGAVSEADWGSVVG